MTILEICAVSALVLDVIRLIIDILKYRSDKKRLTAQVAA